MALDEAQILDCLLLLGLPTRTDKAFQFNGDPNRLRDAEIATLLLQTVNAAQEAKVVALLAAYEAAEVDQDTDTLDTPEGLRSDPAKTRARYRQLLADTISFTPGAPGAGGISLMRG